MAAVPAIAVATASAEAMELLDAAKAASLLPAIAAMEGVEKLTAIVLRSLGMGSSSGMRLVDCDSAAEATKERLLVANELVALDSRLGDGAFGATDADRAKNTVLSVARLVSVLVDALKEKDGDAAASKHGNNTTSYVVTQTEEERGFTLPAFGEDEIKKQKNVLGHMYNMRGTKPHNMPTLAGMRKIAYWVKNETCWPDPGRVSLESMRRAPTDSALLRFRRIVYGVAVVAAGEKVSDGTRHEGAGGAKKFATQWADGDILEDLMLELMEAGDRLPEAEMETVIGVMHESLFKSTSRGNESVSLAASRQMCKVVDYAAQSKLAAVAAAACALRSGGGTAAKSPVKGSEEEADARRDAREKPQGAEAEGGRLQVAGRRGSGRAERPHP